MIAVCALLAVCAGLSMNLVLQCGLGLRSVADGGKGPVFIQAGILFVTPLLLWTVFSPLVTRSFLGFFEYFLVFPVAAITHRFLDWLARRFLPGEQAAYGNQFLWNDGLAGAALFIMLNLAGGFAEAAALSLGFAGGILFATIAIAEIRRRATMEVVPRFLRGRPLAIISMGLLSLILGAASIMLSRALGGG